MINLFTAIAVVNTLSMATAGRRREFALLRPAGAQSAQVLRMLAWEAVLTCAVALLLAALVCAAVLVPLSIAVIGSAVPALAGGPLAAPAAGAPLVAVATTTLVGRSAIRSAAANARRPAKSRLLTAPAASRGSHPASRSPAQARSWSGNPSWAEEEV
ncbi:FtsX-like permease family protein [Streptomyces swartbergensis]|uniref:FtsX-like permease family protein n=1 Tax=Streptomyces swartbergensis TaxID=487165 RepID=UPI003812FE57